MTETACVRLAAVCVRAARPAEPAGPAAWTALNWAGVCVQTALFILALAWLWRLAGRGRN